VSEDTFSQSDADDLQRRNGAKRKNGSLPYLDDGILDDVENLRAWLTGALRPKPGWRVDGFIRHGRQRDDTCELELLGPGGTRRRLEIPEQRLLSAPASLRATVTSATDGLVRPGSLVKSELEDVWLALVTIASVTANQSLEDEARVWLAEAERAGERLDGHTFEPDGRLDAIRALKRRDQFDAMRAKQYTDPNLLGPRPRPAVLIDRQTGARYMRVGEVSAFLRHVIGVQSSSQAKIDGRLSGAGAERVRFVAKNASGKTEKADVYRLPEEAE
jgi:hypothetical protein